MTSIKINKFQQSGNIYLWKYTQNLKNFPGFHMTWNSAGKNSLLDFLTLLKDSDVGTFRTLNLTEPSHDVLSVPNNKKQKIITRQKLRIELISKADWKISVEEKHISLALQRNTINEMLSLIPKVGNYVELSIDNKDDGISFWW